MIDMDRYMTPEQEQADDAQWAALRAELVEDVPASEPARSGDLTADPSGDLDDRHQPQDADAERQRLAAEAAAQADQWEDQQEALRHGGDTLDVMKDPIGYFQQQLAMRDQRDFVRAVQDSETKMRQETPDYDAACQHLESARMAQLEMLYPDTDRQSHIAARQALGPKATPADLRAAILNNDRMAVAQQALMHGKSPAQLYYEFAQKFGYRSGAQPIDNARRGQRTSGNYARSEPRRGRVMSEMQLANLYEEDPEAFDREWDRYAAAHR